MRHYFSTTLIMLLVLCILSGISASAQNEQASTQSGNGKETSLGKVVVTATKTEVKQENLTKSVDVISSQEIEASGDTFLPEALDNLPGVRINRNGGTGQYSTVSIRGVSSSYTQFQFNGIPLNDVADTQGAASYFIEDMFMPSSIERIEVLKGTGSTLYGSRAIGGVINIIPAKPKKGLHFESRSEFGGEDQLAQNARISYGADNYYLVFSPVVIKSVGEDNDNGYTSKYYDNKGFSVLLGFNFGKISADITSLNYFTDLGLCSSPSLDSNGNIVKTEPVEDKHREGLLSTTGINLSHKISDSWDYTVKGAYTKTKRHYIWDADFDADKSYYDGEDLFADMQHNLYFSRFAVLSIGGDYRLQKYYGQEPADRYGADYIPGTGDEDFTAHKQKEKYYMTDLYSLLQLMLLNEMILLNTGGRYVMPENFDKSFVYDLSGAISFRSIGTKIHSGISTGYRIPSLYELYGGYLDSGSFVIIGNKDLEPEKSINYEAGVDQNIFGYANAGLTAFLTNFEDRIVYDSGYKQAEGKSYSKGFESYLNFVLASLVKLDLAYTYVKSEYKNKGTDAWTKTTYLPNHKFTSTLSLLPVRNITAFVRASYRSSMIFNVSSKEYKEDGEVVFDCNVGYKVNDNVDVWLRGENLLDKEYTEGGYYMPGRQIYGGLKLAI